MKILLTAILILSQLLICHFVDAQTDVNLKTSARVDTTKHEVKEILQLYTNYLQSRPDSIYDNPYWDEIDKQQYKDYDFSRMSLFQNGISLNEVLAYFSPYVLSIEKVANNLYTIRTLYSDNVSDNGTKVWCIHLVNAIKTPTGWKLQNYLRHETANWNLIQSKRINYHFPKAHVFNNDLANKSTAFCEEIIQKYNPNYKNVIEFYITESIDEMGRLEGFDFYFTSVTTGKTKEGMVFSGKGSEFYPHEFIHALLPINDKRGKLVEEGLATFLGTKQDKKEYADLIKPYANDYFKSKDSIDIEDFAISRGAWRGYNSLYPAGAILCELVYNKKGEEGIRQLINTDTSNARMVLSLVLEITQLDRATFKKEWESILLSYN